MLNKIKRILKRSASQVMLLEYKNRFQNHAFTDLACDSYEQYDASITRLYHTIEKGLSYRDYRAGFGKKNVDKLISTLEDYSKKYDTTSFFYETALACLHRYIEKNRDNGFVDEKLESRIRNLPGKENHLGGCIEFEPASMNMQAAFIDVLSNRHSVREFTEEPVDVELLKSAIGIAQHTPSACNRQGWKARIIATNSIVQSVLQNQSGNRGFGEKIDKLIIVTSDLRYFQKDREIFQAYIDGGMYAENIINSLEVYGIGSIPLSASLLPDQEKNIRRIIGIADAEVLVLLIGVGNRPQKCVTTWSKRRDPKIEVI